MLADFFADLFMIDVVFIPNDIHWLLLELKLKYYSTHEFLLYNCLPAPRVIMYDCLWFRFINGWTCPDYG